MTVIEKHTAKNVYEVDNSPQVLLSLATGLFIPDAVKEEDSNLFFDYDNDPLFKSSKNKKRITPTNHHLFQEVVRRKEMLSDTSRTSNQRKRGTYLTWLISNPRTNPDDVNYLTEKVRTFSATLRSAEAEQVPPMKQGPGSGGRQWRGDVCILRLLHAILDNDYIIDAFHHHDATLTRAELDGRHNPEAQRIDVWTLLSDKWEDEDFKPMSLARPDIHDSFATPRDLSYEEVKDMGGCSPKKAKDKILKMRGHLLIIKNNYERSGMGDNALVDNDEPVQGQYPNIRAGGSHKRDFLGKYSPAVLYMWEIFEERGLLHKVMQKIGTESVLDGDTIPTIDPTYRISKRKRKQEDESERKQLEKHMLKTAQDTNTNITEGLVSFMQQELRNLKEKLYMERLKLVGAAGSKLDDEEKELIKERIADLREEIEQQRTDIDKKRANARTIDNSN